MIGHENAFSTATLVFMQSLTGNEMFENPLAVGDTNGQASCVVKQCQDIMDTFTTQQPSLVRTKNVLVDSEIPLVLWRASWHHHYSFVVSRSRSDLKLFEIIYQ